MKRAIVIIALLFVCTYLYAQTETIVYSFSVGIPSGELTTDEAGNLYGATLFGGMGRDGTIFKIDSLGNYSLLWGFDGVGGSLPNGGLARDSAGNLYGTAEQGGADGWGVVFKLDTTGNEKVLYSFQDGEDGSEPKAGLVLDADGNLYGTTEFGGVDNNGVVFKVDPNGTETVLHTFLGGTDGLEPLAGVTFDDFGNLYGTTEGGGNFANGVLFKIDHFGNETILHHFGNGTDGAQPAGGVTIVGGNLLGSTLQGGRYGKGAVYAIDRRGVEHILHSFRGADGCHPTGNVIVVANVLYGTTNSCGPLGLGLVYQIEGAGKYSIVHSFAGKPNDGTQPGGGVRFLGGALYGTTELGGTSNQGVVFKISR